MRGERGGEGRGGEGRGEEGRGGEGRGGEGRGREGKGREGKAYIVSIFRVATYATTVEIDEERIAFLVAFRGWITCIYHHY